MINYAGDRCRNRPMPFLILHSAVAEALGIKDGDIVQAPDGGLVGGAGKPPTATTRPARVVVNQYIPLRKKP